jgi:hypothetical protein
MEVQNTFKCVIPLYGLPRELTTARQVEVDLNDGAGMAEVIGAIKEKLPALDGSLNSTLTDTSILRV